MGDGATIRPRLGARVLFCGYYGEYNLGGAALLAVPTPAWSPVVTAGDQRQVRQHFGVATCPRAASLGLLHALVRCQVLVWGVAVCCKTPPADAASSTTWP